MVTIILTSDWHISNATCNIDLIRKIAKEQWENKPVILLGDLVDMGLDRGMEFDNTLNPQDQIDTVEEITKNMNIVAYCYGNHELRIFKKVGLSPYKKIFGMKATNEYYTDYRTIYFNHGKSMAQNSFLEHTKYAQWVNADLIGLGHSHLIAKQTQLKAGKIIHYVRTGCLFDQPTYATQAGFAPQLKGWAEYNTTSNIVTLKAIYRGKVIEI